MAWTIYCRTHTESGRKYVGLTKRTVSQRWVQHCAQVKKLGDRSHFVNAIRKYGKDAFTHEILEVCETLETANGAEKRWISEYDTRNPERGFNIRVGGSYKSNPERENPWDRPEYRKKRLEGFAEPGYRARLSAALREPLVRKRLSDATKKAWEDPNLRSVFIMAASGRHRSEEERLADSANVRRYYGSTETHKFCKKHGLVAHSDCFKKQLTPTSISYECKVCVRATYERKSAALRAARALRRAVGGKVGAPGLGDDVALVGQVHEAALQELFVHARVERPGGDEGCPLHGLEVRDVRGYERDDVHAIIEDEGPNGTR